tara:strand:+ start:95 stop:418 length:324 start_codon:yes stop_codon:yes gene_type:complete
MKPENKWHLPKYKKNKFIKLNWRKRMSHFYGYLDNGINQTKTMRGFTNHGLTAEACSWNGKIRTRIYQDKDGVDRFVVSQETHQGNGVNEILASGKIGEIQSELIIN